MRRLRPAYNRRAFTQTVGRFVLYGPLVGGAPYAWLLFTLPFIYAVGLVPSLLAGLMFAAWLDAPARRPPGRAWRAVMGAVFGAAGGAVTALGAQLALDLASTWTLAAVLALHGAPAGLLLAVSHRAPAVRVRTAQPAMRQPAVRESAPAAA
jgi:hypothetical protein